ncbi:MAG TPA: enoyl-CoA hydratase/isomerase family protein [Anaerolineales bacterium]|nr:enoyl-CoA hydratase/isomerase family protein [Anaerolineales bacterium]
MTGVSFIVDERGIGLLSIDRPQVRNALNWAAMQACAQAIEAAHRVAGLKALIVAGAGKAFVSGGDLSELQHYPTWEDGLRLAQVMGDALARLEALPCPTIAAINGPARGGGAEIAVACDLRVMAEDADLGFVHTRLGIIPAWGGGQRLMRIVGYAHALELIATGRVLSAGEALARGLVNLVAAPGQALAAARELAAQIANLPAAAVQAAKRVLRKGLVSGEDEALAAERAEFPALWDTDFRNEAIQRFLKKYKPGHNGRAPDETPNKRGIPSAKSAS